MRRCACAASYVRVSAELSTVVTDGAVDGDGAAGFEAALAAATGGATGAVGEAAAADGGGAAGGVTAAGAGVLCCSMRRMRVSRSRYMSRCRLPVFSTLLLRTSIWPRSLFISSLIASSCVNRSSTGWLL